MLKRVLVVEDYPDTAADIAARLRSEGFAVDCAYNGRDGLYRATDGGYDAIVLDRILPHMDGMTVLRAMRGAGLETPVLMLSQLASVDDRVAGLNAGADDYLGKPFAFDELRARLVNMTRRAPTAAHQTHRLACADLRMDLLGRRVTRGARAVDLQPKEMRMLEYLLRRRDQVVTRTMLLEGVWNFSFDPRTPVVEVHISRLRRKLHGAGEAPLLHTVRGVGYRMSETP